MAKKKAVKFDVGRIGQTDETSDLAMDALMGLGMSPGENVVYIVDIGVKESKCIVVKDVPPGETSKLYAEGRRRNPDGFRASLLYYPNQWEGEDSISYEDFIAGK